MSFIRRALRTVLYTAAASAAAVVAVTVLATLLIESSAGEYLYDSTDDIPYNRAGLLLGTTPYSPGGGINPYFYERIDAAARLYRAGKVSMIIVSGDNATRKYNEPRAMRRALIRAGVPGKAIVFDCAGFRTLDSIVRASLVFGQSSVTIISQRFQNLRAVYIARANGMRAIAYNASDSGNWKVMAREYLSRVKCLIDLYVLHTKPRFLGAPIEIEPEEKQNYVREKMPSAAQAGRFTLLSAVISDLNDSSESPDCGSFCRESLLINTIIYDFQD